MVTLEKEYVNLYLKLKEILKSFRCLCIIIIYSIKRSCSSK